MRKRLRDLADQALSPPTTILSFLWPHQKVALRQNWDGYKAFDELVFDRPPS